MTRFVLVTDTVHAAAAGCDYLEGRVSPDDEVLVLAVAGAEGERRDAGDALNVVSARLAGGPAVETSRIDGDPVAAVLAVPADELVLALWGHASAAEEDLPEPTRDILSGTALPVVVLPPTQV